MWGLLQSALIVALCTSCSVQAIFMKCEIWWSNDCVQSSVFTHRARSVAGLRRMDATMGGKRSKHSDSDIWENRYKKWGGGCLYKREKETKSLYLKNNTNTCKTNAYEQISCKINFMKIYRLFSKAWGRTATGNWKMCVTVKYCRYKCEYLRTQILHRRALIEVE